MVAAEQVITLAVLLFLSGFFSGSEVALVSLSKARVEKLLSTKRRGAKFVQKLKSNPQRMLATILLGNNLVNVGASALVTAIMVNIFDNYAVGIATGVMTLLILVFGEITPKSIAIAYNETIACMVAPVLWYLSRILSPVLIVLEFGTNLIPRGLGLKHKPGVVTHEDILGMIHVAEKEGALKPGEEHLIRNILEFDDKQVSEVLTPRKRMVMCSSKDQVSGVLSLMARKKLSRLPVYEKSKENIVGVVYAKELLTHLQKQAIPVKDVMQRPLFIPENAKLSSISKQLQKRREQMAIVVDEHGVVTGLVTLEDMLEEVFGEIHDEAEPLSKNIVRIGSNRWFIDGETGIDEVAEKLGMKLEKQDFTTFGGYVLSRFGKIPDEGDQFSQDNYNLVVQEVKEHRIGKVLVEKK
jgi:putative hemolysin